MHPFVVSECFRRDVLQVWSLLEELVKEVRVVNTSDFDLFLLSRRKQGHPSSVGRAADS